MPQSIRFVISGRVDAGRVAGWLAPRWRVVAERAGPLVRRYLDTFDWALWRRGGRLILEGEGGSWRVRWEPGGGGAPRTAPLARDVRFAAELPAGVVQREVAAVAGIRALLGVGEVQVTRRLLHVTDAEGKTVVRLWLETVRPPHRGDPSGAPRTSLRVEPLVGYARTGAGIAARLRTRPELNPAEGDELTEVAAAAGRTPGDYTSKVTVQLAPDQPAEEGVRRILAHLLATLVANVDGTVQDLDTEFLHDLRVATRRTRTCLGQLRGVLPAGRVGPSAEEFRWLADATTPCRDLDVFLLDLHERRRGLAPSSAAALGPLLARFQAERDRTHAELVEVLESARFRRLTARWRTLLAHRMRGGTEGTRAIAEVAGARVLRAYRRLVRHGRALGPDAPTPEMHRLRIDGKKLRYLLEFFASLWDGETTAALVQELKLVQDTLGSYHDAWLLRQRVLGLADEMLASGAGAATLLEMGRLVADLERRQAREAREFIARFDAFSARPVRIRLLRLVRRQGAP